MEVTKLEVSRRATTGSNASNQLRKSGKIPGVLYGHKQEAVAVEADATALSAVLDAHAQYMELNLDGAVEAAIVREVQYDPFGQHILHVDFVRVSADEQIEVPVAIEIVGLAKGVQDGGILEQHLMDVTIRCRPGAIPEKIVVNVAGLGLSESIQIKDLKLPDGAIAVDDPDKGVVGVVTGAKEEEDEEEAEPVAE